MNEQGKSLAEVNALREVQLRVQDAIRRERRFGNSNESLVQEGILVHWTETRKRLGEI